MKTYSKWNKTNYIFFISSKRNYLKKVEILQKKKHWKSIQQYTKKDTTLLKVDTKQVYSNTMNSIKL